MRKHKRITALIVAFSMIFALINFTVVSANSNPKDVKINFVTSYIIKNDTEADTVEVGINIKSENTTTFGSINAMLQYDSDIIVPIPWSASGDSDSIYNSAYDTAGAQDWDSNILIGTKSPDEYSASAGYVFNKTVAGDSTGYLNLHSESQKPTAFSKETRVITARFGLKPGKTIYDITEDTIEFAGNDEVYAHSMSSIEYSTGAETYHYNDTLGNTQADMLIPQANITFAKPAPGDTVNTGGSGGGGGPSGPTDPSDFVALNIYNWDDSKITTQVAPKGQDVSSLMPTPSPLPGYIFAGWASRMTPELDENGQPVLGDDGNPVLVRNQSTPNVVTGAPGVKYPSELLVDITNITENMDLIPAYDEDAQLISDTVANRRYTISGRTPFVAEGADLKTTVTINRSNRTRRINYNNGTVVLKVEYKTDGKGTTTVFIEGGATDEEKIDIIVSGDAKINYAPDAVNIMVLDYRTDKSRAFGISNIECVIGE